MYIFVLHIFKFVVTTVKCTVEEETNNTCKLVLVKEGRLFMNIKEPRNGSEIKQKSNLMDPE
jgi:hypothetical protein